jgi:hypothetical protein
VSKVGDVYDRHGNRIGEVRRSVDGPGAGCSSIIFVIVVVILCGVGAYFGSVGVKNYWKYGKLTSDTKELQLRRCIPGSWTVTSREFYWADSETFRGGGERLTFRQDSTGERGIGSADYGAGVVYTGDAGATVTFILAVDFRYNITGHNIGSSALHESKGVIHWTNASKDKNETSPLTWASQGIGGRLSCDGDIATFGSTKMSRIRS